MKLILRCCFALVAIGHLSVAMAHHSYAMFDATHTREVSGVVAKLEWMNPHVYVWLYVKDEKAASGYTLYGFENGAINVLSNRGWSKFSLKAGDAVTVAYWPLRDGRAGGHFTSAKFRDGRVLNGAGGPRGVDGTLPSAPGGHEMTLRAGSVMTLMACLTVCPAANALPDWSGWWTYRTPLTDEVKTNPPPLRPEMLARRAAALLNDEPEPLRYCRPLQFTGSSDGFLGALEFLFTPGRVTMTTESGMLRRVYTDGRRVPEDPVNSNMGTSIGHWEGETLVIETVGINPEARYPNTSQGNLRIGRNAHITEYIRLAAPDTLEFVIETLAPELLTRADRRTRLYKRVADITTAREISLCAEHDRAIDPATGAQRFDLTPPADLPPPPRP